MVISFGAINCYYLSHKESISKIPSSPPGKHYNSLSVIILQDHPMTPPPLIIGHIRSGAKIYEKVNQDSHLILSWEIFNSTQGHLTHPYSRNRPFGDFLIRVIVGLVISSLRRRTSILLDFLYYYLMSWVWWAGFLILAKIAPRNVSYMGHWSSLSEKKILAKPSGQNTNRSILHKFIWSHYKGWPFANQVPQDHYNWSKKG